MLPERVALGKKFPGQDVVDDRDRRSTRLIGLRCVEGAPAQQMEAGGRKIICADAVPASTKSEAIRGRGRVRSGCGVEAGALDFFA